MREEGLIMNSKNDHKDKMKMSAKNKKIMTVILAVIFVAFAVRIGINLLSSKEEEADNSIPVSVMTAEETGFEEYIEIFGTAKPERESVIVPKIPATVEKINVKPGQSVKKGDVLFVMSTEDIDSQLKQAEAGYEIAENNSRNASGAASEQQLQQLKAAMESARINYEDARVNYDRIKTLYENGGVSKKDFEQIENGLALLKTQYETAKKSHDLYVQKIKPISSNIAQAQLKQAEAGYESAKKQHDDMIVRADIDGEIGVSKIEVGKIAGAQGVAMTVVDYRKIVLDLWVTEENVARISDNSVCKVKFDVLPEREFNARIEGVGASVDPASGLYQVKLSVDNSSTLIKPGMYASIKIFDKAIDNAITLPTDTVIRDGEDSYVFVLGSDGKAQKRKVTSGADNGEVLVISSGLKAGEKVIFRGQDYLDDGDSVRVVTE